MPHGVSLTAREAAIAIWLFVALFWMLTNPPIRRSLIGLVLPAWRLRILWVLFLSYVALEAYTLSVAGIWQWMHMKETVIWSVSVAMVLLVRITTSAYAKLRHAVLENFGVSVVLEFLMNLYPLPFLAELVLFPMLLLLGGTLAVAQAKKKQHPEYKQVERLLTTTIAWIGVGVVLYTGYEVYQRFHEFAKLETLKDFFVPIGLSFLFTPFLYGSMLYAKYEQMFAVLPFYVKDAHLLKTMRLRLIWECMFSVAGLATVRQSLPRGQFNSKAGIKRFFESLARQKKAEPPTTFRGLAWGTTPSTGFRTISSPNSDELSIYAPDKGAPLDPFLGVPVAEECYSFDHGKFYSGSLWINGEEYLGPVRRALSEEFGPPTFMNEHLPLWKWNWTDPPIEIQLMHEKRGDRITVTMFNKAI